MRESHCFDYWTEAKSVRRGVTFQVAQRKLLRMVRFGEHCEEITEWRLDRERLGCFTANSMKAQCTSASAPILERNRVYTLLRVGWSE